MSVLNKDQEAEIGDLIKKLSTLIINVAEEEVPKSKKERIKEEFMHYSTPEFVYNMNGPDTGPIKTDRIVKEHWYINLLPAKIAKIALDRDGKSYVNRIEQISEESRKYMNYNLNVGVNAMINLLPIALSAAFIDHLEDKQHTTDIAISNIVNIINDEPQDSKIILKLENIFLGVKEIKILISKSSYTLRQTESKDLEYDEPVNAIPYMYALGKNPKLILKPPSAIMKINIPTKSADIFFSAEAEKVIPILRLFKVGGVSYLTYNRISDAVIGFQGWETEPLNFISGQHLEKNYWINKSDINRFSKFFIAMINNIPKSFYDPFKIFSEANTEYIDFAYNRYCESLLNLRSNSRKISEAIMGLESLYSDNSHTEVSYKLRIRIAKIMGYLGKSPISVLEDIKYAYGERSKFLHGNNTKKTRETNQLLLNIQDYLRISIVFFVLSVKNNKNRLIGYLDKAVVDTNSEEVLINEFKIKSVQELIEW